MREWLAKVRRCFRVAIAAYKREWNMKAGVGRWRIERNGVCVFQSDDVGLMKATWTTESANGGKTLLYDGATERGRL